MNLKILIKKYRQKKMLRENENIIDISSKAIILTTLTIDTRVERDKKSIFIGADSMVGANFIFESNQGSIRIGERSYVAGGVNLIARSDILIGNDVTIAWGVYIYTHDSHSLDWKERAKDIVKQNAEFRAGNSIFIANKDWTVVKTAPIHINDKAWIGMNAIILKGVTIGEGAIVGAGSVVTKDVPPWTVVAGNPARVVKKLEIEE